MASTYSTNLALELIGTGDQAGTWGVTTNTNLGTLLEQAISGYVTQAVSTGTDTTITIPNGSTGVARNMYIELTGTGGTNTNLIVPANKKLYFIFNNASGAVTVKVSGQTGVSVPTGKKMILVSNGTDIVNGVNYIADFGTNSFTVTNLTATSATITNLIATTATVSDLSATVLRAASASITNLALTSLTISSLSITNVSVASATVSSNLTLSGGTANGVLYLNGSKVATSGTALVFDGTNLGVGTTSPTKKIDARVNTAGEAALVLISNDNTAGTGGSPTVASLEFASSGVAKASIAAAVYGNDWLSFRTGSNTERMRLTTSTLYTDSSINVGIGTSSPATKLDTAGTVRSTTQTVPSSGTGAELYYDATNAGLRGYNRTGSAYVNLALNDNMYVGGGSSGNVGIGTSTPSTIGVSGYTRLVLGAGGASTDGLTIVPSGTGGVQFTDAANVKKGYLQWDASTGALALGTAGTTKATLTSGGNFLVGTTSGTATITANASGGASIRALRESVSATNYIQMEHDGTDGKIAVSGANALIFATNSTNQARITSGGLFLVNATTSSGFGDGHRIFRDVAENTTVLSVDGGTEFSAQFRDVAGGGYSTAGTAIIVGKNSSTSRSINAGGTVNASGADYAEYMEKAGDFVIAKGDVCGIDADGKLTNVYTNAVAFVVKSTNPSYVGGDSWGAGYKDDPEGLEAARQKVDRIAFSGQVPVNVLGATPGQYIVPVNDNGAIKGVAVSNPSFEQYQMAIGKVIAIEDDGRARIIVKIA